MDRDILLAENVGPGAIRILVAIQTIKSYMALSMATALLQTW